MKAWWVGLVSVLLAPLALAQPLPTSVQVAGNSVQIRVGAAAAPLADLRLDFDQVSGLSAAALGVQAERINILDPALLARLPELGGLSIPGALALLVTLEPPPALGLDLRRRVHVELHTHALVYQAGSRYRLFKAPLGGAFRDITTDVLAGSVRTRGSTGSFSQFLVVLDLRDSADVVAAKLALSRSEAQALPAALRSQVLAELADVEAAVADSRFADAGLALDSARAAVSAAASGVPDRWVAGGALHNVAGELLSAFDTLSFSIGYLRDFGP